nr:hypothetical protein [Tanacetum cinerariifolium]
DHRAHAGAPARDRRAQGAWRQPGAAGRPADRRIDGGGHAGRRHRRADRLPAGAGLRRTAELPLRQPAVLPGHAAGAARGLRGA